MTGQHADAAPSPWSPARAAFLALTVAAFAGFAWLGMWQLQRLEWKRDLIARVDARIHAEPVAPPARRDWPGVNAIDHEYTRVRLAGRWLGDSDTRVQAVTRLGAGWWLLRPLRTDDGEVVLVNRGFVPTGAGAAGPVPGEPAVVTGLLRVDEPGGAFLRDNDADAGRWFSRDVQAIAARHGLAPAAPYFIDADASGAPDAWPAGGLTVTRFRDNHLPYALTWFTLAGLAAFGAWRLLRDRGHQRAPTLGGRFDAGAGQDIPG